MYVCGSMTQKLLNQLKFNLGQKRPACIPGREISLLLFRYLSPYLDGGPHLEIEKDIETVMVKSLHVRALK